MQTKLLSGILLACISFSIFAEENHFKKAQEFYSKGKYESALSELEVLELRARVTKKDLGLIVYWKALALKKSMHYDAAIKNFKEAILLGYPADEIYYELAQAAYGSENYTVALENFAISYKKNYKPSVCLYYLGFISKEMGRYDDALTFLQSVKRQEDEERADVLQPAEALIGDIYFEQLKQNATVRDEVVNRVIPQYESALKVDEDSELGPLIQEKITKLQKEHELVLFKLSNGRSALRPQYFLRAAQAYGLDSNVTFSPANTTVSSSRQSSSYSKTDFSGRYTFYPTNFLSLTPDLYFSNTYYFNRVPEIYRNDNFLFSTNFRTKYEHVLFSKPATFLLDYERSESRRDVNAKKRYEFSSTTSGVLIGESFQIFSLGETTIKFRYRDLNSYLAGSDSYTHSFLLDQFMSFGSFFTILSASYDQTRVVNEAFDTNGITVRGDFIFPEFKKLFSPSFGISSTVTDPINDRNNRGTEILFNPSVTLSRAWTKRCKSNLRVDYQNNKSRDRDNFAYQKTVYSVDLDYNF